MNDDIIAYKLAEKQKEISIAEFFEKNRHLLGFDNKRKALLTVVKEAVDNSLDACEDASVLPEIHIDVVDMSNDRFRIVIEDNGPGIIKKNIPNVFAKLLYGSKFFKLSQSRGQQGIGISAAVLYSQLTTGKPVKITSRIHEKEPAHYYELMIDTKRNEPHIIKEDVIEWNKKHGTKIELDIEASYQKGNQSVDEYIKETAIINPHATIIYTNPKAEQIIFARATDKLPKRPKEIKPHPYGVELGILLKMLKSTEARTLTSFFVNEFSRVGHKTAKEICDKSGLLYNTKPRDITRDQAERIIESIRKTKINSPPIDCISPIGPDLLEKGLKKEIKCEFYTAITRPASVYRGNPFVVEVAIAYGGNLPSEGNAKIMRFANRVPLLYQQGACAITKAISSINWKTYGLQQSTLPSGPVIILVHIASVWVPFTSESKEAIAHYPEIIKEIKLALQECGRKLGQYIKKKIRIKQELKKKSYIEKYIPFIGESLGEIIDLDKREINNINIKLKEMLEKGD